MIKKSTSITYYKVGDNYDIKDPVKKIAQAAAASNVERAQEIIRKNGFTSIDAGFVQKGEREVIIKPKNIVYRGSTLNLR